MGHKANICSLDFHPYGEFVASGSQDTNIKVSHSAAHLPISSSVRDMATSSPSLGTEDLWTRARHFNLRFLAWANLQPFSLGLSDLEVFRALSAQSCTVPSGLASRDITTSCGSPFLPPPLLLSPTALGHQEERLCLPI